MRRLDSKQYSCDFIYKFYVDKKRCSKLDIFFINIFDIFFHCRNIIYKYCFSFNNSTIIIVLLSHFYSYIKSVHKNFKCTVLNPNASYRYLKDSHQKNSKLKELYHHPKG